jgi:hypothetical protein
VFEAELPVLTPHELNILQAISARSGVDQLRGAAACVMASAPGNVPSGVQAQAIWRSDRPAQLVAHPREDWYTGAASGMTAGSQLLQDVTEVCTWRTFPGVSTSSMRTSHCPPWARCISQLASAAMSPREVAVETRTGRCRETTEPPAYQAVVDQYNAISGPTQIRATHLYAVAAQVLGFGVPNEELAQGQPFGA